MAKPKKQKGVRAKARDRVRNAVRRLQKNGYTFKESFIEKINSKSTHFEKIDIDKIYENASKGGVSGKKARNMAASERARRAARTRKERQQNKVQKPDNINIVRSVLHELNVKQYLYGSGLTDVTSGRNYVLSFYDDLVNSADRAAFNAYLQTIGEQLMMAVNSANNAFYWEELQECYTEILTLLKGSALTVEESISAEQMSEETAPQYYEEEYEDDYEDYEEENTYDYEYMGYVKDPNGYKVQVIRDTATGNFFREDTGSHIILNADNGFFIDEETEEILK